MTKYKYINFVLLNDFVPSWYFFVLPALLLFVPNLFAQENNINKYSVMNYEELTKQTLAEIGPLKITVNEFVNNYEFGPAFVKRMNDSKRRHLDYMIYEKLLALEGLENQLDTLTDVKLFLKDIRDDLAGEKMYRNLIWDKIKVTAEEITEAAEKQNTSVSLKWIFTKDQNEAMTIYSKISGGAPFDTFFNKQFLDTSVMYDDRILESNIYQLERINPSLASVIDSLSPDNISAPISTSEGFYIIKLENILKEIMHTESAYHDQRYKLESALKKQKADSVSDQFINELFKSEMPVIVRTSFNGIAYSIGSKYLQPFQVAEWNLAENVNQAAFSDNRFNILTASGDTLIRMNSESILISNFIDWYSTREAYIKFTLKSKNDFLNSVENVIWRMLRDYLITRLAKNFGEDDDVNEEMNWWRDKVVYSKMKQIIASSIKFTEEKLLDYYNENKKDYTDESGQIKVFKEAEADVKNDYYVYEYTKRIVNKVLSLKNKYLININLDLLSSVPVTDENNPRSINLYSVKKGGTFVRPVYPVIDNEWQFWN